MPILYLDTETRSATPLNSGVYRYVADPYFAVILCTWAVDDEPVQCWDPVKEPPPVRLFEALNSDAFIYVMHNSAFDRRVLAKAFNVTLPAARIHDTAVQALAHGMPAGLGVLSEIFDLGEQAKMKEGKSLIQKFSKPRRQKSGTVQFNTEQDRPADWALFRQYAVIDVEAMRRLYKKMPRQNYPDGYEHVLWQYDQTMNDRGLLVDVEMSAGAVWTVDWVRTQLGSQTAALTDGAVSAASQTAAFLAYLNDEMGADLPNLRASTLQQVLDNPDTPADLRNAVNLRIETGRNAAAKYKRLMDCVDEHGRLHDTIQFMGAARTGRDGGRTFQPQNLPRTTMWGNFEGQDLIDEIDKCVAETKACALPMLYKKPLDVLGNLLRSVIVAPPGHKFAVADLSNIEGRSLVWLANEDWKLDYFRDYDAGRVRFDNYVAAYAKAMNIDPADVTKAHRQIGKVMELGLGYGGGVSAFLTFAAMYHLDISALAGAVAETAEPTAYAQAKDKYQWAKKNGFHGGLPEFEFTACEYLKTQWRAAHPEVCRFWKGLDSAFRNAINHPRTTFTVDGSKGKVKMYGQKGWVIIRLPSGRILCYFSPRIEKAGDLSFMGLDGFTRRWTRIKTYSGKLAENVTSATARDVMFRRIPDIEAAGYRIIMRVHDELVAECPDTAEYGHEHLAEFMSTPHSWCSDLPLAAAGFTGYRYRGKD